MADKAYHAAYHQAHKEIRRADRKARARHWKTPSRRAYMRRYRALNAAKISGQKSSHYHANKPVYIQRTVIRMRKLRADPIPAHLLEREFKRQNGRCQYCKTALIRGTFQCHLDHIIPLSRGGRHEIDNVQWLCQPCNGSKRVKDAR